MENKILMNNLNKKWLQWFVGFSDAEGNFQVYPKKRTLKSGEISKYNIGYGYHLSLHKKDVDILKEIKNKLNDIGTIYEYPVKPDSRLAVNNKAGLIYLIDNIFDLYPLKTKNQLTRYLLLKDGLLDNIKEFKTLQQYNQYKTERYLYVTEQVKSINHNCENSDIDNWLIGFINGEGCFYMKKKKCNFYIEHTDRQALEMIKQRLLFGPNVLERSARSSSGNKKERKTIYQLHISSKKDIETLVIFLDNKDNISLQGNKYRQYLKWKQKLNY